jgi:protein-disulfide isomerase-like protein with CxxC motif
MTKVEFWFDPACPWTWITSRWMVEVAERRNIDVTWNTFSLLHHNGAENIPAEYRTPLEAQWRGLRVIEAARAGYGNDAVAALYTAFGSHIHHDSDSLLAGLAAAVAEADVDPAVLDHANDDSWDHGIRASTESGSALVGKDVGIPIIRPAGARSVFFGPVMSPAPKGDDALKVWDAFVLLTEVEGVYEVKRSRHVGPEFGPRPS